MAGIQGKNTKPELVVRRYLHRKGLRFRLHERKLPGRPDLVLSRYRTVVEVNGCFWHQHPGCRYAYMPASNQGFWKEKLAGNRLRDLRNWRALRRLGWRVIVVWECETASDAKLEHVVERIRQPLRIMPGGSNLALTRSRPSPSKRTTD